ncbi:MAG: MarR family winged helix-turn-helix transcriptional regulator, partial [Acidimicrobiales bacterium]
MRDEHQARGEESDPITLAGLVFETSAGLRRAVGPQLEQENQLPAQSFEVLIRLSRSPGARLRMSELASQTALTPSGLTRAIDRLVCAGLVRREACNEDRRGAFAALSSEGKARMEAAICRHRGELEKILTGLYGPGERAKLAELLERLRDRVNPGAAFRCSSLGGADRPRGQLSDET